MRSAFAIYIYICIYVYVYTHTHMVGGLRVRSEGFRFDGEKSQHFLIAPMYGVTA